MTPNSRDVRDDALPARTRPRAHHLDLIDTPAPLQKRGVSIEQWLVRFLARDRLPSFERAVFDLILAGEAHNIRQMAEVLDHNTRRVHEAIDYLEQYGYIRCPVDTRGRRGAYLPADE